MFWQGLKPQANLSSRAILHLIPADRKGLACQSFSMFFNVGVQGHRLYVFVLVEGPKKVL